MIDKKKKQLYQIFVTFMLCIIAAISLIPFIYLIITSCVNDMSLVFKKRYCSKNNIRYAGHRQLQITLY